jgi:hypothetical protein
MLSALLDAGVMFGVIALITGETPEFLTALLVSFGFALSLALGFAFLGPTGGLIALLPLVGVFGAILSMLYGAPLKWAVLGSLGFLAYKIAAVFVWAAILG